MEDMQYIATKLRKLREEKGLTQEEVAKALNIAKSTLGNYEIGRRTPDLPMLTKLAEFYGVSLDYFRPNGHSPTPWWERDEPPSDIELWEFVQKHSNLKLMGDPLDEDAKHDILLFLRAAHEHIKQERKKKAAEAAKREGISQDHSEGSE
ncbi:Helix-turn-helix [Thermanaeromonas toyohensis ToBE]|uniref:Helix-turn-helix n=1 Tax=Thermanaeromonas toyohensis ToBE TaxID=698762 RepID=A0A1W1VWV8_9FIRM|nr:helix-turn-helix transcriptional regulator [Thermanaeromonas toyohensis]SMB97835.1 Helix-turn-helix [Thermanaeromonas toyohensis ToBE]